MSLLSTFSASGSLAGGCVTLVFLRATLIIGASRALWFRRRSCRLVNDAHHGLLECLSFEEEAVLVPDKVWRAQLEIVSLHAALEERKNVAVVRVCREAESAAIVHELLELGWLIQAEFVDGHLLLLALDVIIFFVLRASWKALPRQRAAKEVEQHVSNGLEIVPSALLIADMGADRGVSGRSCQVLSLTEGNVLAL